jgi:hypothetical protein
VTPLGRTPSQFTVMVNLNRKIIIHMVIARIFLVDYNYRVLAKRMQIVVHSYRPRIRLLRTLCTVGRIARPAAILCRQTSTCPRRLYHFYHTVHHTSSRRQSLSQQCSLRQSLSKQCFPASEPALVDMPNVRYDSALALRN